MPCSNRRVVPPSLYSSLFMARDDMSGKSKNPGLRPTRTLTFFTHRPLSPLSENLAANHYRAMPNFDSPTPVIDMTIVSDTEKSAAEHLYTLLVKLNYYVRCFEADVQLYEFSAEQTA